MKKFDISKFKDGWFIGDFEPSVHKTKDFEVGFLLHRKGEKWDTHYHKIAREINYLIEGEMVISNTLIQSGEIFILEPGEIADPTFLTDCKLIVVKTPSVIGDKYILNNIKMTNKEKND